jgi:hypothetical protein
MSNLPAGKTKGKYSQSKSLLNFLQNDTQIVATYDLRGSHIYTGNSKGKITIVSTEAKDGKDFTVRSSPFFTCRTKSFYLMKKKTTKTENN